VANNSVHLMMVDVSRELLDKAKAAKAEAARTSLDYDKGRHFALYEVISLLIQQAEAFGVEPASIGLAGVDPEQDLLGTNL
jgi:hypothetical protein